MDDPGERSAVPDSVVLAAVAAAQAPGDLLALPFSPGPQPGPGVAETERALGVALTGMLARQGFRGQPGDVSTVLVTGGSGPRRVAALGVAPEGGGPAGGLAAIRDAAQRLASLAAGSPSVATTLAALGPDRPASVRAAAEGFLLGRYRPGRAGSRPVEGHRPEPADSLTLLVDDAGAASQDALDRGIAAAEAANWVRDLVHAPAATATPAALAGQIAQRAREHGARAQVWTADDLRRQGFGGVLGVGQGSRNPPALVEVEYSGSAGPLLALTGKGVTFDSGGLNLKRDPAEIAWMRADMAGGAAAAAAVIAAARLRLPVRAVAVVPLAENMPGGGSLRPGDVLTHRGGRTSEVMDADAEGRLVVADAVAYLAERGPAALIDVATLTDAGGIGHALWAAMGTDQGLLREVLDAGEAAGEPGWQLPLRAEYRPLFASSSADLRNTASRGPDTTVMAATFLREFAGDAPWVHIDKGSTAWLEFDTGLWPEGATGSPTRALLRFLE